MGAYVYKISTKPVGTFQGRPVYPSQFAYKPWLGWRTEDTQANARMSFRSGCESLAAAWRRKAEREGTDTVFVLFGQTIIAVGPWGAFIDDAMDPTWVRGSITELEVTDARHLTTWSPCWRETLERIRAQGVAA